MSTSIGRASEPIGPYVNAFEQYLTEHRYAVRVVNVVREGDACVHPHCKGHKLRSIPLWNRIAMEIRTRLRLNPTLRGDAALLPNCDGQTMSRSNVAQRLDLAVIRAAKQEPNLSTKRIPSYRGPESAYGSDTQYCLDRLSFNSINGAGPEVPVDRPCSAFSIISSPLGNRTDFIFALHSAFQKVEIAVQLLGG